MCTDARIRPRAIEAAYHILWSLTRNEDALAEGARDSAFADGISTDELQRAKRIVSQWQRVEGPTKSWDEHLYDFFLHDGMEKGYVTEDGLSLERLKHLEREFYR